MSFDYSLYLVTDSTETILGKRDLLDVVVQALEGGVTVVQYRDKTSSSRVLQETASKLHDVTQRFGVPLLINDRVDIALAIGAEGVHLGQDDMDLSAARAILGPKAIIGVTCANVEEAEQAATGGADYLGIGTLFATPTKTDTKHIIGTAGAKTILEHLSQLVDLPKRVAAVAIGGINKSNVQHVLFQSKAASQGFDGVAVVSAVMAAENPKDSARNLRSLLQQRPAFHSEAHETNSKLPSSLVSRVPELVKTLAEVEPLSHNMINQVVINFAANVALAVGARPIMSHDGGEAEDLARLGGCLVINMGTVRPQSLQDYIQALKAYNAAGGPVLFDPVGAGATALRRETVKNLMAAGYFDIIKGNESEVEVVYGASTMQQRGVDSSESTSTHQDKACLVRNLARRERNIAVLTGKVDYLSDGRRTYAIRNGHKYLGRITGSGCTLGTVIASFAAVERQDKLLAALAAILMFEIAAEHAGQSSSVLGPGTFVPAFIDSLYEISSQCKQGKVEWLETANVELIENLDSIDR